MPSNGCELCRRDEAGLIVANEHLRVVLVDEAGYPGYARVIWNEHVREMTDLAPDSRMRLMATVFAVEAAQRAILRPHKMNAASLGNLTPHLHWHVIPRFADDAHFPGPIWSAARRTVGPATLALRATLLPALHSRIAEEVARVR